MFINIGRYWFAFGDFVGLQITKPMQIWHWWRFWFGKEARPEDIDKKQKYPLNTLLIKDDRKYRYWKWGSQK